MSKFTLKLTAFVLYLLIALPLSAAGPKKVGQKPCQLRDYVNKTALANWSKVRTGRGATTLENLTPNSLNQPSIASFKKAATRGDVSSQAFKCALLYSENWDEDEEMYGAYSFNLSSPNSFTRLYLNTSAPANGGGFFTEDKFYFTNYTIDDWGYDYTVKTYVVDTNTWKLVNTVDQGSLYALAEDMAYDPIEKVAFGAFYSGTDGKDYWGYMNLESCEITYIALLDGELVAVAINNQGEAYGITNNGYLVKINKYTGELTAVGYTTVSPYYMQSAAFSEDGTLYWAASTSNGATGLFTVDTTDGHVALVNEFTNYEEIAALYAEPKGADSGAPAEASNLVLNFTGDALSGTISFDVPSKDNLDADMSGEVSYSISIDGVESVSGKAAVGAKATVDVKVASAGVHTFAVKLSNDKGSSKNVSISQWIGIDRPEAVSNLALTKVSSHKASLSWTAPTKGAQDGFFDASRLSYTVTRLSDGVVVASGLKTTTFDDELTLVGQAYVTYRVTAYADDVEGSSAVSNGAIFGDPYTVPVSFTFDTEADYNLFTVIDTNETLNQDSGMWQYTPSGQAAGYTSGTKDGDDWLITPDITLKADREYLFSYDVLCYSNEWPDNYEVYMGKGATVEAMTTKLVDNTQIYWDEYRTNTVKVTVPEDGVYNFAFRALSEAGGAFFLVDNITLAESYVLKAPAAVTNLKLVAGEKGAYNVAVSFNAPALAVDSTALESISKITVTRGADVVKTFDAPQPGAELSFVDEAFTVSGNYSYVVVPENVHGVGVEAEAVVWVGVDTPVEPANVSATVVDSHPVLKWEAPQGVGANGGYVDPSALEYTVYSVDASDAVAFEIKDLEFTDKDATISNEGAQKIHQYGVYAKSAQGYGNPAITYVISGEKYALPFNESFKNGETNNLWVSSGTYERWSIVDDWSASPQDDDGGLLLFTPYTAGGESTIFSGKIDMTNAVNPSLSFYIEAMSYTDEEFAETDANDDVIDVLVGTDGYQLKSVKTIKPNDLEKGKYLKVEIPLKDYQGADFIYIGFKYDAVAARVPVAIDNIEIRNNHAVNMAVTGLTVPAKVNVTEKFTASVTVKNDAVNDAQNFVVTLKRGDEVVASTTESEALAAKESKTYEYELEALASWNDTETFTAEVALKGDEVEDDNVAEATVSIYRPAMPVVTDLVGSANENGAVFTWSAVVPLTVETVTEDFESYSHGARKTGSIGDWTVKCADGVYGLDDIKAGSDYLSIPGSMMSQAFIVINPEKAGADLEECPQWAAHSGKQMIVSFRNWEYDNDDWLISPELSGNAQTVSLYARSPKEDTDKMVVLYSTTDAATSSFTRVSTETLETEWTKYSYKLPEGAKYFAIRNTKGGEAVMIDDVTFEKSSASVVPVVVEGYNLYRDGEKVNDAVIATTTYTVTENVAGKYYVTVVCNVGESGSSNVVTIEITGINSVGVDFRSDAPVYDLAGRRVTTLVKGQIYVTKGQKFVF